MTLKVAEKPEIVDPKYYEDHDRCLLIRELIKESMQGHHSDGGKQIKKIGVASKVQGKIFKLDKQGEWSFRTSGEWPEEHGANYPTDLYIYRRLEYLAGEDDYVQFVRKGSGWYALNPVLFEAPQKES